MAVINALPQQGQHGGLVTAEVHHGHRRDALRENHVSRRSPLRYLSISATTIRADAGHPAVKPKKGPKSRVEAKPVT